MGASGVGRALSRRAFVGGAAVLASTVAGARALMPPPVRLGIQLYMLQPDLVRAMAETLRQVREIGFIEVELPGLLGRSPAELATAFRAADLACPSIHVPLSGGPAQLSLDDVDATAETARLLKAQHLIVPMMPVPERMKPAPAHGESFFAAMMRVAAAMTHEDWKGLASALQAKGRAVAAHGLRLGYHNHNLEFQPVADAPELHGLDVLLAETDPALVDFELDVGWAMTAGVDPVALLRRHPRRFRQLHLKDLSARSAPGTVLQMTPADVGAGIVDWPGVMAAARHAKVEHYYVEQEPPFSGPRLASARAAFAYLTHHSAA